MLIPEVTYTDFKTLKADQLKELKSCAVTYNGDILFFVIIPSDKGGLAIKDDISIKAEYLAERMNSISGKDFAEVKSATVSV